MLALGILAITTLPSATMEQPKTKEPSVLLLDLGGIFFDFSVLSYVSEIGYGSILSHVVCDLTVPTDMKTKIFHVVGQAQVDVVPNLKSTCDKKGRALPYLLCLYQAGRITPQEALKKAMQSHETLIKSGYFVSNREAEVIKKALRAMFTPEIQDKTINPLDDGITLLKELAALKNKDCAKKYTLIALSNWDPHSFALLKKRYPEVFALFDDIIISGDIKTIKPNHEAYEFPLKKHNLKPEDCIFIDDQPENINAAKDYGIEQSLLFKNCNQIRQELDRLGVLPTKEATSIFNGTNIALTTLFLAGSYLVFTTQISTT